MSRRPQNKRAMILNQDEVDTLRNAINAAKEIVLRSLDGSFKGTEIKALETALNAFGKATTYDNEKVLDPKVKY